MSEVESGCGILKWENSILDRGGENICLDFEDLIKFWEVLCGEEF